MCQVVRVLSYLKSGVERESLVEGNTSFVGRVYIHLLVLLQYVLEHLVLLYFTDPETKRIETLSPNGHRGDVLVWTYRDSEGAL